MTALAEIADTIENLPKVLATLLEPVDPSVLTTPPAPGEWSVHQVIGHLITIDGPAFRDRITSIVAGGGGDAASFDPGSLVEARDFDRESLGDLLAELVSERTRSSASVRSLVDVDLTVTADFGRHGSLAAADFVHEWPFHDHDHVQQILSILKAAHLPGMTEQMRRALETD
jgi:hypothetical protein